MIGGGQLQHLDRYVLLHLLAAFRLFNRPVQGELKISSKRVISLPSRVEQNTASWA